MVLQAAFGRLFLYSLHNKGSPDEQAAQPLSQADRMMTRVLECGVLLRLYTMTASGLYAWAGITQTETLIYQIAHADAFATACAYGLAVLAVLGTVDLFVNDILPARYVIRPALRDRHLVSMGIAGCFAVMMWTCVRYGLPKSPLPFYALYVLIVPASAFADVNKRYKNKDC